jgi:hypothetical protein
LSFVRARSSGFKNRTNGGNASFLNRLTRDEAQRHYERYIGPYTPDGRADLNIAQQAIDAVAAELGVASATVGEIY